MKFFTNIKDYLKGKKAYLLGALAIIYACIGLYIGELTQPEAQEILWAACMAIAIRAGIAK